MIIKVRRLPHGHDLELPRYVTEGASAFDVSSAIDVTIFPGQRCVVPTGFSYEIPRGFEGQIRPRSGFARDIGGTVVNSPGTIDSDFRGEVSVILINLGKLAWHIKRGQRIAQMVICPVERPDIVEVDELSDTVRGVGGFGSTGV